MLFFILINLNNAFAQSRLQQWDDRIMINLSKHRTEEKTGFLLFMSNTYRYGDVGIPAGLLIGGILSNDRQMRENALYVASGITKANKIPEFAVRF